MCIRDRIYSVLFKGISIGDFTLFVGLIHAFSENVTQIFDVIADNKRLSLEINEYREFLDYPDEECNQRIGEKIKVIDTEVFEFVFESVSFLSLIHI